MKKMSMSLAACFVLGTAILALGPWSPTQAAQARSRDGAAVSYLSVSPSACQITSKDLSTLAWYLETDEFYLNTSYPDSIWVDVPLILPNKAVINSFTVYCTDNGKGEDDQIDFYLQRHKMADGTTQTMGTVTTSGQVPSAARLVLTDPSIDYPGVDNTAYSYAIVIRFRAGKPYLKFNGAKIKFSTS